MVAMEHRSIIDEWPSLSDFASDIGAAYGTAKAMRRRSSIPPAYWPAAVAAAEERGLGVSYEVLAAGAAQRATRTESTPPEKAA